MKMHLVAAGLEIQDFAPTATYFNEADDVYVDVDLSMKHSQQQVDGKTKYEYYLTIQGPADVLKSTACCLPYLTATSEALADGSADILFAILVVPQEVEEEKKKYVRYSVKMSVTPHTVAVLDADTTGLTPQ